MLYSTPECLPPATGGTITYADSGTTSAATATPTPKRDIQIKSLNHGYIVTIGCQTFAIEEIKSLIKHLETYLRSPEETEQKWLSGKYKI